MADEMKSDGIDGATGATGATGVTSGDVTAASHGGVSRDEVKRRALFGMLTKTAFVAPVIASFALDALSLEKAHAVAPNGSGLVATASDRRLKTNVVRIGTHGLGNGQAVGLYEFSYIGRKARHVGVMAQEVLPLAPHAVVTDANGFYRVDYGAIGL